MTTPTKFTELTRWVDRLHDFIKFCRSLQHLPHERQIEATESHFNKLAIELFQFHRELNPAYASLCQRKRIKTVDCWWDIPAMPTSGFKVLPVTCLPEEQRSFVFHSSRTTGQTPSSHYHSSDSILCYESSLKTWFEAQFPANHPTCQFLVLTPPLDQVPHSSLVHMFSTLKHSSGCETLRFFGTLHPETGHWNLIQADLVTALQTACDEKKPVALLGTAFNFVHLLDCLEELQIELTLPHGSWLMETGGYKNQSREVEKEVLHRSLAKTLGLPESRILGEYGMSELSSQAYDHPIPPLGQDAGEVTRLFRFPPWARMMVINSDNEELAVDGEPGLVQVVDLANVYSVLAVRTEDIAIRYGESFNLQGRAPQAELRGCSLQAT